MRVELLRALLPLAVVPSSRRITTTLMSIEVERKFEAPEHSVLAASVEKLGGTTIGTKSFTDVYYDTAGCSLTRRDIWLRARDGAWELKLPVEEDARLA